VVDIVFVRLFVAFAVPAIVAAAAADAQAELGIVLAAHNFVVVVVEPDEFAVAVVVADLLTVLSEQESSATARL